MAVFTLQTSFQTQASIFSMWHYCILSACVVNIRDSLKKRKGGCTRLGWMLLYMHQYIDMLKETQTYSPNSVAF